MQNMSPEQRSGAAAAHARTRARIRRPRVGAAMRRLRGTAGDGIAPRARARRRAGSGGPAGTGREPRGATTIDALFGPLPSVESAGRVWLYATSSSSRFDCGSASPTARATELIEGDVTEGATLVTNISLGGRHAAGGDAAGSRSANPAAVASPAAATGGGGGGDNRGGGTLMSPVMTFRIAFKALGRNKMRTGLTMLGMIIGVSAVITLVAMGNGAQSVIEDQIKGAGTNMITVNAGNASQGGVARRFRHLERAHGRGRRSDPQRGAGRAVPRRRRDA